MDSFKGYKNDTRNISPFTVVSIIALISVMGFFVVQRKVDGLPALQWLLAVFLISVFMRGYLHITNVKLWDGGFGVSFGLGLALSFLGAWLVSGITNIAFNTLTCYASLIVLVVASIIIKWRISGKLPSFDKLDVEKYIWGMAVFAVIYFMFYWVIGFNSAVDSGTENYMDFGFMQTIYRQQRAIPYDLWFSGKILNYYYLGQAAAVYMCRIAFTTPKYGYNLMLCTFIAIVFVSAGEIAYAIISALIGDGESGDIREKISAYMAMIIASVVTAFGGNGHWLIKGILEPIKCKLTGRSDEIEPYWFPTCTVYINTEFGDVDNGKNEFPAYSVILGDLHAHVINVIFVLPLLMILVDYAFSKKEKINDKSNILKLVLLGIMLGLYKGTNYWDFAIYFVITGAVVVFCDIRKLGINLQSFVGIIIKAIGITVLSSIVILPFTVRFQKMATQVVIANNHSPIYKLAILWGVPIIFAAGMCVYLFRQIKLGKSGAEGILAIALCAMGLVLTPEVIYIRDIYGETDARFNTMFKLTYQAYILFGIIMGVAAGILCYRIYALFMVTCVLTVALSAYTPHAINNWMGDVTDVKRTRTISSLAPLYENYEYIYEMKAYDVLEVDTAKDITIIECAGDSYTHESALSVLTGAKTIVGWFVHEWMWRDDSEIVAQRSNEVQSFYESGNEEYCKSILDKYNVDYIFLGPREYNKYSVDITCINRLGDIIWEEYDVEGRYMLIKVAK